MTQTFVEPLRLPTQPQTLQKKKARSVQLGIYPLLHMIEWEYMNIEKRLSQLPFLFPHPRLVPALSLPTLTSLHLGSHSRLPEHCHFLQQEQHFPLRSLLQQHHFHLHHPVHSRSPLLLVHHHHSSLVISTADPDIQVSDTVLMLLNSILPLSLLVLDKDSYSCRRLKR